MCFSCLFLYGMLPNPLLSWWSESVSRHFVRTGLDILSGRHSVIHFAPFCSFCSFLLHFAPFALFCFFLLLFVDICSFSLIFAHFCSLLLFFVPFYSFLLPISPFCCLFSFFLIFCSLGNTWTLSEQYWAPLGQYLGTT